MGMPNPGVEGRGGEAERVFRRVGREARDTGEVGRDTVMGMEVVDPVRVKPLLLVVTDMLVCVLVKLLVGCTTGLTATMRLPSPVDTTTSLCPDMTSPLAWLGTMILWVVVPVLGTSLTLVTPTGAALCSGSSDG